MNTILFKGLFYTEATGEFKEIENHRGEKSDATYSYFDTYGADTSLAKLIEGGSRKNINDAIIKVHNGIGRYEKGRRAFDYMTETVFMPKMPPPLTVLGEVMNYHVFYNVPKVGLKDLSDRELLDIAFWQVAAAPRYGKDVKAHFASKAGTDLHHEIQTWHSDNTNKNRVLNDIKKEVIQQFAVKGENFTSYSIDIGKILEGNGKNWINFSKSILNPSKTLV